MNTKNLIDGIRPGLLLCGALFLALATGGCIFSPDTGDDPPPGPAPELIKFPQSEEILMENFQTIYEQMDFQEYTDMLHPDFLTILQASTIDQFPDIGATIDRAEDLHITQRMFSGSPVTNPDGELVPGIAKISFELFERQGTWETSPANDVIPNARWATYDVGFLFDRGQGNSTLKVQGQINFYLTSKDSVYQGNPTPYFQMIGQKDLTLEQ